MEHTFVICAYKESPYLEACIRSLKKQTVASDIIITTSTPNTYIKGIAEKYNLKLYIRNGLPNITMDWNFGYEKAETPYLTIAHQDDIYLSDYTKHVLEMFHQSKKPLIYFSDYAELRDEKVVVSNKLLKIKRLMLLPFHIRWMQSSIFVRRRVLSLGSPICCPSVAYARNNLPKPVFANGFRSNEDWEAWEKISRLKGQFLFDNNIMVYHRIHADSETTAIIHDNKRSDEDLQLYQKFWPKPIAKLLAKLYASGQRSNDM